MKLSHIYLDHYRCFEDLRIEFAPSINVLTGDNASGKTTVEEAVKSVLSSFFVGFSDENTRFVGISESDFTEKVINEGLILPDSPVKVSFNFGDIMGTLERRSRKNANTLTSGLSGISSYASDIHKFLFVDEKQEKNLPLFVYFSTKDIHKDRKATNNIRKKFKQYAHKPSFGYYECLQGGYLLTQWISRLLILKESSKGETEITGIKQAIIDVLGTEGCNIIQDMEIRPIMKKVFFHFVDGREIDSQHLSDGYTRLVNIVMDIAFRCLLLNKGKLGADACKQTEGVVLIDELDLHLHPELQINILKGLKNAFPKLQFIVSTHAPLIMSNIEINGNNKIFKLSYNKDEDYSCIESDVYGMDVSTIVSTFMDAPNRAPEVEEMLSNLFDKIDKEQYDDAKVNYESLKNRFTSGLPELSKAKAMLDFLTEEKDDTNS